MLVPLLYAEIHLGIPLVKALVFSVGVDLDRQLALVYVFLCVFLAPLMLARPGMVGPGVRPTVADLAGR